MEVAKTIDAIRRQVNSWHEEKRWGRLKFVMDFKDGGITEMKVITEIKQLTK